MLDQILAAGAGRIEETAVRQLLGLADTEVVDRLIQALLDGDASIGMAVLTELDDRGRDAGVVLEQLVEEIRTELAASLAPDGDRHRGAALAALARRLADIDPERRGVGGTRFQLELVLLDAATRDGSVAMPRTKSGTASGPAPAPTPTATRSPSRAAAAAVTAQAPVAVAPVPVMPAAEPAAPGPAAQKAQTSKPSTSPPAAQEPAAPAGAASDAAPKAADIDELRARWPEVVAFLSQNPPVKPLIEACRPISVEDHLVTLGFPEDKAFLKIALERRGPLLEEGIGRILGRTVNVRCVATNLEHVPAVAIEAENADLISEARRIFADDLVDVGEVS